MKQNIHRAFKNHSWNHSLTCFKLEEKLKALMPDRSGHFQHSIKY